MLRAIRYAVFALLMLLLLAMSFGAGSIYAQRSMGILGAKAPYSSSEHPQFGVVWEVWHVVETEYIDKATMDYQKMAYGAIRGMLESLGDPRTVFLDKTHNEYETAQSQGSFDGIGASVAMVEDKLTIVEPMPESPAEKAGIKAGDVVQKVDGADIKGLTVNEAVEKIRGPRGTVVTLTLVHKGDTDPIDIPVTRDQIKTKSVILKMLPDNIAHMRITNFGFQTYNETTAALKEALGQNAKGLIIDLRSNPGGLLDITVDITSQFVKEGVVTYQVDAEGKREAWNVKSGGIATQIPIVVLINGGSASGSEILAGALRDFKRATLIGEKSFGKGSVQHARQLSDGSAVYVTISRWITPNGEQIDKKGIDPDIEIKLSEDDIAKQNDSQLNRAVEFLKTGK